MPPPPTANGCFPREGHCDLCRNVLDKTHEIQEKPIRSRFDCESTNIIYVLECDIHRVWYVGYTSGNAAAAWQAKKNLCEPHLLPRDENVGRAKGGLAQHFGDVGHLNVSLRMTIIDSGDNVNQLKTLKDRWIDILEPQLNINDARRRIRD